MNILEACSIPGICEALAQQIAPEEIDLHKEYYYKFVNDMPVLTTAEDPDRVHCFKGWYIKEVNQNN